MKWLFSVSFLICVHLLGAQKERCYDKLALEGRIALSASDYAEAIDKFKSALDCPDLSPLERENLAARLEETTNKYLAELDGKRAKALEARKAAEKSREQTQRQLEQALTESENLKVTLEVTRKERDEANRLVRETEAGRLMLLAKSEVLAGRVAEGLGLAAYVLDSLRVGHRHPVVAPVFGAIAGLLTTDSLTAPNERIKMGAIAPDGDQLLLIYRPDTLLRFTGADTIRLYNVLGKTMIYIPHELGKVLAVDFSADGGRFVATGKSGLVGIWDRYGREIKRFTAHNDAVLNVVFLSGDRILTCSRDRSARIWDLNGNHLSSFQHLAPVYSASFAPDANRLLTRSADRSVKLWDAATGHLLKILDQHHLYVYAGELSGNGRHLLTASAEGTVRLWDISGKLLHTRPHPDWHLLDARFAADSQHYVTVFDGGRVEVSSLSGDTTYRHDFASEVHALTTSVPGQALLAGLADGRIEMRDYTGKICLLSLQLHRAALKTVAVSPREKFILTIDENGTAFLVGTPATLLDRLLMEKPRLSAEHRARFGIRR